MVKTVSLSVSKMKCGGCVASVKKALEAVDGVASAQVDLESASAIVEGNADAEALISAIRVAGFDAALR